MLPELVRIITEKQEQETQPGSIYIMKYMKMGQYVSPKIYVRGGGKYNYVPCEALASDIVVDDSEELEYVDDSTDYLLDLLKKKRKDEPVEPVTITHNTCDDNNTEEVKEDFIILMKLKKLGYLEPVSSINSCITYEENVTAIKLYQEENGFTYRYNGRL